MAFTRRSSRSRPPAGRTERASSPQGAPIERKSSGYQPKNSDIVIAVFGPTGTGKSTFVNQVAGRYATEVSDSLSSCTKAIKVVECKVRGRDVVMVDTPGFNDTTLSDMDVLGMIAKWLQETYEGGIQLSGLLYFHRICDNRMAGTPKRLLDTFKNICGASACQNVILTTTMWDEVDETEGADRVEELRRKYWASMLTYGARTARFLNTSPSAFDIISLIDESTRLPVLLQRELVDQKKTLPQTAAGKSVFWWLSDLLKSVKQSLKDLQRRLSNVSRGDVVTRRALKKKLAEEQKKRQGLDSILSTYSRTRARSQDTLVSQHSASTVDSPGFESPDFEDWHVVDEMANPPNSPDDGPSEASEHRVFLQGTITSLRIMRELAGLAPIPGVRNVVTLAMNIVENVEAMGAVDESLLVLARNTSSLATSVVEATDGKVDLFFQARIREFIRALTEVDETVKVISARSTAVRYLLSMSDKETVENCNRSLILATSALGMQAAIQNCVSNARLEEKMDNVLTLLRAHMIVLPGVPIAVSTSEH